MPVDTAKVDGRRRLNYGSFQELLADADRLHAGPTKVLGNWSAGQIFKHLALAYNGSIDGFTMTFPWPLRTMARLLEGKLINGRMPPGFRLPAEGAKALAPGQISDEQGLADLHAAVARLESESERANHPMFGRLTNEEWNKIHLKHASLHMSFLVSL